MELQGTIKLIGEVQTFASGFSKQEIVITTDDKYPQDVKFEFMKDKAELLTPFEQGQQVEIAFNVQGREYNGNHYVSLTGWKIKALEGVQQSAIESVNVEVLPDDDIVF